MTIGALPGATKFGVASVLPWIAALLLALLHLLLFTRGYRMSADDAFFLDTLVSGYGAVLDTASAEAQSHGRIGMYLLRPLNSVAAYLAGYYPMRLLFVALHYLNFMLFAMLASRIFKANLAPLLFVLLVVMHPLAFEHMPPNAYPLQNTIPFLAILSSRLWLFRLADCGVGNWHTPLTTICYLVFALGMCFSEYSIVFGTALLLTEYLARLLQSVPTHGYANGFAVLVRLRAFRLDALAVAAVVSAYLVFRWSNPSHYDGNSPDGILQIGRMLHTATGHIVSGTVFGQMVPGLLPLGRVATLASIAAGALAAFCAYRFIPMMGSLSRGWSVLAIAAGAALYVVMPVAMTSKQQSWCIDRDACGFLDSRVSYFWVGLATLAIVSLLMQVFRNHRSSALVLGIISVSIGVLSSFNYANNVRQAERMAVISLAWDRARTLACLPERIPQSDDALKKLIDPDSAVMFHPWVSQPSYWKRHVAWLAVHGGCAKDRHVLQAAYLDVVEGMHPLDVGQRLKFASTSSRSYLVAGWSPEPWGVWSVASRATLKAGLRHRGQDLILVVRALRHDVNADTRPVDVEFNGTQVATLRMTNEAHDYTVKIPANLLKEGQGSVLTFVIADPISPLQAGSGVDARALGVGLVELKFVVAK